MPEPIPSELPDEALVLRGGGMSEPHVVKAARKHAKKHKRTYAISVRCRHDYDEAQLFERLGYAPYMLSTVGQIRAEGYNVVSSEVEFGDAHADLVFGRRVPKEGDITKLKEAAFTRRSEGPKQ